MTEPRPARSCCSRTPNPVLSRLLLGVALSVGALSGVAAAAQAPPANTNPITNPDFNTGISGWTTHWFTESDTHPKSKGWSAAAKWVPDRDAEKRRDSGSLELAITAAEGRCAWASQCIAVGPGTYELTGDVFIHTTAVHTEGAWVNLEVFWEDQAGCQAPATKLTRWSLDPTTVKTGQWATIHDPRTFTLGPPPSGGNTYSGNQGRAGLISVPAQTRGALVQLSACVSGYSKAPETVIADFDHLGLRAVEAGNPQPVRHP